jgi:endo-1,4-beta-xylanase
MLSLWPRATGAQELVRHGFEDGTTQGWVPRGGATLVSSDEAALAGPKSLRTTGSYPSYRHRAVSLHT